MEIQELHEILRRRSGEVDAQLMTALSTRKRRELEFHDRERAATPEEKVRDKRYSNRKFYSTNRKSQEYVDQWIAARVPHRVFLDYACGNGKWAINAAKLGSALAIGIDVSDVSIQNARAAAAREGVAERCIFLQADCENTGLPDESIDVVLCSGMLHHLDLSYAFPELRRILRKGGCVLAVEALNYNPLIKLYRKLTPSMRTEWEAEHILSLKDLGFAARFFEIGDVRYWHLSSLAATVFRNSERLFPIVLAQLDALDDVLLRIPGVRLMGWQFTFELFRRETD